MQTHFNLALPKLLVLSFFVFSPKDISASFRSLSYARSIVSKKTSSPVSCDVARPLWSCSLGSHLFMVFQELLTCSSSSSPAFCLSVTCFRRHFIRNMWPIKLILTSFYCRLCRIFLSSFTFCNTSSFLTRYVQLISSVLFQHHVSKLSRYFWSLSRSVQVSALNSALRQMQHFTSFFFKSKSIFLVKKRLLLCWTLILPLQFWI